MPKDRQGEYTVTMAYRRTASLVKQQSDKIDQMSSHACRPRDDGIETDESDPVLFLSPVIPGKARIVQVAWGAKSVLCFMFPFRIIPPVRPISLCLPLPSVVVLFPYTTGYHPNRISSAACLVMNIRSDIFCPHPPIIATHLLSLASASGVGCMRHSGGRICGTNSWSPSQGRRNISSSLGRSGRSRY